MFTRVLHELTAIKIYKIAKFGNTECGAHPAESQLPPLREAPRLPQAVGHSLWQDECSCEVPLILLATSEQCEWIMKNKRLDKNSKITPNFEVETHFLVLLTLDSTEKCLLHEYTYLGVRICTRLAVYLRVYGS